MTDIRSSVLGISLSLLLAPSVFAIDIHSTAEAVNIAGKQRMYTQRMLKDYAMIGMGNTFGNPADDLKDTIKAFDNHLHALQAYTKDAAIKKRLDTVATAWKPLKRKLKQTPDIHAAKTIQGDLENLLKLSNEVTGMLADASGKQADEIVNIAGRQRMLSQRMASLYMLKVWGIDDPHFKENLDKSLQLFKTSLNTLEKAPMNDQTIKTLLAKVKRSFMFFEIMNRSTSKFIPSLIYKKSDDMLKNMDRVTHRYVELESK